MMAKLWQTEGPDKIGTSFGGQTLLTRTKSQVETPSQARICTFVCLYIKIREPDETYLESASWQWVAIWPFTDVDD